MSSLLPSLITRPRIFEELTRPRLFEDFGFPRLAASPAMDVFVKDGSLHVVMDLPGFAKDAVEVTASGRTLSISASRDVSTPEGATSLRSERGSLRVSRTMHLDAAYDTESISASLENGVLTVTVAPASSNAPATRTIEVK